MQNFITIEMIEKKLTRTNRLTGILLAVGAGCIFPVCDCGVVPVVRRLLTKRVPPYMALAFLVTAPLVNPITIWATATAFSFNLTITLLRVGLAVAIGVVVALIVSKRFPKVEDVLRNNVMTDTIATCHEIDCGCHGHGSDSASDLHHQRQRDTVKTLTRIFNHANEEFLEVGKFLIIGALIAAMLQTYIPKESLLVFTENPLLSVAVMMGTALALSLCAEADAFVARSFSFHFPLGSVMGFMVFGQMFDIKNTALLLKHFKTKAVIFVIGLCAVLVFLSCSLLNILITDSWVWGRF